MFWKKLQLGFIVLWPRTDCKLKSSNSDNSISFSAKNKVLFFGCSTQEWNEVITNKKKTYKDTGTVLRIAAVQQLPLSQDIGCQVSNSYLELA